ncbi:hypothetical protein [Streptomyces halstedii]|uniref:hypothetical protein n=1 Tax=Streptomyces halstedii TaxID=1944 RepID=UPI003361D9B8
MALGEIYVQLSVRFPDDSKVRALARYGRDARRARDLYVQMLLYCKDNLSDGFVPAEQIGILVYPDSPTIGKKDAARLVEVGLIEQRDGGWCVSAFLKRNKSGQAIRDRAERRAAASAKANHTKWHVNTGESKPDCDWCQQGAPETGTKSAPKSDPNSDSDPSPAGVDPVLRPDSTETETESQTETETETQKGSESSSPPPPEPEPGQRATHRPPPAEAQTDDDDDLTANERLDRMIVEILAETSGRTATPEHAAKVRRTILDGRQVQNPPVYVARAIRAEPGRFTPPEAPQTLRDQPWMTSPAPNQDEINARGGAAAKEALRAAKERTSEGAEP